MENLRLNALALHLEVDVEDLNICSYDGQIVEHGNRTYIVVTDTEADDLWEQSLENYLDEIIYPELPENFRNYFNDEAWKADARYDGRGHSLSSYDGEENEITIWVWENMTDYDRYTDVPHAPEGFWQKDDTETFYIYRQD